MAVARFASGRPVAETPLLLHTIERTALTSIVAVNVGGTTKFSAWIVPSGEDANPNNWIYYVDEIPLTNRNSFETFKIAVNVNDKIYVESLSGDVTFFINGIYDIAGRANITASDQAPESPQLGDIWIDTNPDLPITKYWSGAAWIETGQQGPTGPTSTVPGPTGPQGTFDIFENAPTGPDAGDVWFNSSDGRFYVYYDGYWVEALSNEAGPTGPQGPTGATPAISVTGPLTITGPTGAPTLGLVVGLNGVQAYDADLASIAELGTPTLPAFLRENASGVWSLDTTDYASLATGPSFAGVVTANSFIPSSSTAPTNGMYLSAENTLNFATNSTNRFSLAPTGPATFTSSVEATSFSTTGSASAASFIPSSSTPPTNGMYLSAANTLNFATNSTNRLSFAPTGPAIFTSDVSATSFSTTGAVSALTYSGSVASTTTALNFATETFKTISIAAATTFTASNYSAGRTVTVRVTSDATQRALTFPTGWVFVGTRPTAIAASKTGILTITSFGTTEANCVAAWAVQA